jgi:Short C-terminal domain
MFARRLAAALGLLLSVYGCASAPPIRPADAGKSAFEGAVFKGTTVKVSAGTPGSERYRVYIPNATGDASMESVRDDAAQRAKDFCHRQGKVVEPVTETTTTPPYLLGNYPRIEMVFDCVDQLSAPSPTPAPALPADSDPKYTKLVNLKKLLDTGVLTQAEFDREKTKILALP